MAEEELYKKANYSLSLNLLKSIYNYLNYDIVILKAAHLQSHQILAQICYFPERYPEPCVF
jgi:hypothetical protein